MERATILIVDDELFLRMDLVDLAQEAGFATLQAASAAEALELLEQRNDIRVLLTDIRMPGEMDGLGLALEARAVGAIGEVDGSQLEGPQTPCVKLRAWSASLLSSARRFLRMNEDRESEWRA